MKMTVTAIVLCLLLVSMFNLTLLASPFTSKPTNVGLKDLRNAGALITVQGGGTSPNLVTGDGRKLAFQCIYIE